MNRIYKIDYTIQHCRLSADPTLDGKPNLFILSTKTMRDILFTL